MLSAAQAQSEIRFLLAGSEPQAQSVYAFANGEFLVRATRGRFRLSDAMTVRAANYDLAGGVSAVVKMAALGEDRIEIDSSNALYGFSGISTDFQAQSSAESSCTVRRFGADESVRWYQRVADARCTELAVTENSEIWLASSADLLTLRADGTLKQQRRLPANERAEITGLEAARGANVGGAFIRLAPTGPQFAAIAFIDASGVERWRVQTNALAPSMRALADGGVEIAASSVQTFNAGGQRVRERFDDAVAGTVVGGAIDANNGERWVLTRASECALTKLGSNGRALWRTPLPCEVTIPHLSNNIYPFGGPKPDVLLSQAATAVVGNNAIAVLNQAGAVVVSQAIDGQGVIAAAINPSSTQLLYVRRSGLALQRLSIATRQDQAITLPRNAYFVSSLLAQETAPNGTTFAVSDENYDQPETLMAIAPSGQLLWQVPAEYDGSSDTLVGGSDQMVCIRRSVSREAGESELKCWNGSSGLALFALQRPENYFPNDTQQLYYSLAPSMRVYGSRVLIARDRQDSPTFLGTSRQKNYEAISDTGASLFAFDLPGGMTQHAWGERGLLALNQPGSPSIQEAASYFVLHGNYVGFLDSDVQLSLWDQNGQSINSIAYPYAQSAANGYASLRSGLIMGRVEGVRVASSDPRVIGLSLVPGALTYEFFDLNGNLKWRQPAALYDTGFLEPERAQEIYPIFPGYGQVEIKEDLREAQPVLYALRGYNRWSDQSFAPRRAVLQKIDLNTGAVLWRRAVNVDPSFGARVESIQAISLPKQQVNGKWQVLVRGNSASSANSLGLFQASEADFVESFDAASGASLDVQPISDDFPQSAIVTAGIARFVVRQNPPPRTAQAVGAPSQIGAWYNPAMPGQGFFIERIGNTQFMAWFHSDWNRPDETVTDLLSPARQRWLTLQGDAVPGSTQSQLKIYQTSGGSFVNGGAVAPVEIGTATLTFLGCDSASLTYELAAQRCAGMSCTAEQRVGMLHGVIPLRALLPASSCPTSTSLPAPVSAKSGLFHDPSVPGQGLMTVVNANTLFAGWFTRDPADAADDPHKQAWFTLQATVPAGNNTSGTAIQAKIYRTLGGRRDAVLPVSSQEVGEATLSFPSCDRVTMQYRFAAGDAAKPFQNVSGQLNLVRIGACR
jgi:hypothetical protein